MALATTKKIKGRMFHIILPCFLAYMMAYVDRSNMGFAFAGGMMKDLSMNATVAGFAAGFFAFGYLVLQLPAGHISEKGSAKKFIGITMLGWGVTSILTGYVENLTQLLIIRFLFGVAEGGMWPSMIAIINHWYTKEERARAVALFSLNYPIAAIISALLSGWIVSISNWHWLFFIEGGMSLLLMFIWYPLVSDFPKDAKWLSEEDRDYLNDRLAKEQEVLTLKMQAELKPGSKRLTYWNALGNINTWKLMGIYLCWTGGVAGYTLWLPVVIESMTKAGMAYVGILSAIPYVAAIGGLILFGNLADRSSKYRLYLALPLLGFAVALWLSTGIKTSILVSYVFLVLAGLFWESGLGAFWSIPPTLFPTEVIGGVRGIITCGAGFGSILGKVIFGWFVTLFGSFDAGMYGLCGMLFLAFLITLTLPKSPGKEVPQASLSQQA